MPRIIKCLDGTGIEFDDRGGSKVIKLPDAEDEQLARLRDTVAHLVNSNKAIVARLDNLEASHG
jgi:hypothetical protein